MDFFFQILTMSYISVHSQWLVFLFYSFIYFFVECSCWRSKNFNGDTPWTSTRNSYSVSCTSEPCSTICTRTHYLTTGWCVGYIHHMWQFYKRNLGATNWRRLQCEFLSLVSSRAQAARDYVVVVNNNNNNNNNNEYVMRHDKVCTHLHYSICKALGIETTDKWYTHIPKPVCEDGDVTVLWNQALHTVRKVTANRPDKIIKNKKENMHTDRCGNTRGQKCRAKGSGK